MGLGLLKECGRVAANAVQFPFQTHSKFAPGWLWQPRGRMVLFRPPVTNLSVYILHIGRWWEGWSEYWDMGPVAAKALQEQLLKGL